MPWPLAWFWPTRRKRKPKSEVSELNSFRDQTERIAVWVFGSHPLPEWIIEPVLWGLEEEGIPGDVQQAPGERAENMAKRAADGSPLNVGIGINTAEKAVALHHRDLPVAKPLFLLGPADMNPPHLRRLGANAARLVKGEPLIFLDESLSDQEFQEVSQFPEDALDKVVALVVANILNDKTKGRQVSWKSEASDS